MTWPGCFIACIQKSSPPVCLHCLSKAEQFPYNGDVASQGALYDACVVAGEDGDSLFALGGRGVVEISSLSVRDHC